MRKYKQGNYIALLAFSIIIGLMMLYFTGSFVGESFFGNSDLKFRGICGISGLVFVALLNLPEFFILRKKDVEEKEKSFLYTSIEMLFVVVAACALMGVVIYYVIKNDYITDFFLNNESLKSVFIGNKFHFFAHSTITEDLYFSMIRGLYFLLGNHTDYVIYLNMAFIMFIAILVYYLISRCNNKVAAGITTLIFIGSLYYNDGIFLQGSNTLSLLLCMIILTVMYSYLSKKFRAKEDLEFRPVVNVCAGVIFGVFTWINPIYFFLAVSFLLMECYMTYPGTYDVKAAARNIFMLLGTLFVVFISLLCLDMSEYDVLIQDSYDLDLLKSIFYDHIYVSALKDGYLITFTLLAFAGGIANRISIYAHYLLLEPKVKKNHNAQFIMDVPAGITEPVAVEVKEEVKEEIPVTDYAPIPVPIIVKEATEVKEESLTDILPIKPEPVPEKELEIPLEIKPQNVVREEAVKQVKVEPIPNPMKEPKKHERKEMDFLYEVAEEDMHFDYEVPENLSHFDY